MNKNGQNKVINDNAAKIFLIWPRIQITNEVSSRNFQADRPHRPPKEKWARELTADSAFKTQISQYTGAVSKEAIIELT